MALETPLPSPETDEQRNERLRFEYTAIGHATRPYWNPVPAQKLRDCAAIVDKLLTAGSMTSVLDVGCGRSEFLIELALLREKAGQVEHVPPLELVGVALPRVDVGDR